MHRLFALFVISAVIALVILLFVSADFAGCKCYYVGKCEFDVNGTGYRYYFCGNCPAYSAWHYYYNCDKVRIPLESVP